ncbi:MAG: hypothetical protein IJU95_09930, partial [Treponema sp.]|nr:hypothetical protein [Treponema sp.]
KENDIGSFFYSLIKRFTIFLFLFQTVMLTLYYSGNFQSFQDSSLRIILFCASLAAVMLFSFSTIGIISSVVMALSRKRPGYVLGSLIYVILDVLAAAVFISLRGLAVLTSGIR